jgi:hypothetical protein
MNSIPSGACHSRDHILVEAEAGQRGPEVRQGVQPPGPRIDQAGIVVLPAGLVLLRAVMVVHRDHDLARLPGGARQVDRGLAAVGADLQHRPGGGVGGRRTVQGQALGGRHEAACRLRRAPQVLGHGWQVTGHGSGVGHGLILPCHGPGPGTDPDPDPDARRMPS